MRLKGKVVFYEGLPFLSFLDDEEEHRVILFENDVVATDEGAFKLSCENDLWKIGEQKVFPNEELIVTLSVESYEARNFIQPML